MKETTVQIASVVTENPELSLPLGSELHFEANRFLFAPVLEHDSLSNPQSFLGAVLSVAFPHARYNNVLGSAVMVAPGIAISAAHVLQECLDEVMANQLGATCLGLDGDRMDIWRIRHVTLGPDRSSDLAILSLELSSALPDDRTFNFASISTRTPALGERLILLGYRQIADPEEAPKAVHRQIEARMFMSSGRVAEHHPTGRDKLLLPGPCLQVDCHTVGGMSGGPVFDEQGLLVGILSSSVDGGPSWVSLVWPALCWGVRDGWPVALMAGDRRLLDLDSRLISIDRRDVLLDVIEGGAIKRTEYRSWS